MTSSLVGSEMCIRDSLKGNAKPKRKLTMARRDIKGKKGDTGGKSRSPSCLLYTSDAADDM
eukprot:3942830-Prorocentrum_lima.AAC.1